MTTFALRVMRGTSIATLVRNARAVRLRKGNMVLLNPRPNIEQLLTSMGITQLIPVSRSLEEARVLVRAVPPVRPDA